MATQLLNVCTLHEQRLSGFIFIRENCGIDGSFLISSILGQRLKYQQSGTILMCCYHTFDHYDKAGMRLGYNLNMGRNKGHVHVIEPLSDMATMGTASKYVKQPNEMMDMVWHELADGIKKMSVDKSTIVLLIDDLSLLINLGASEEVVLKFCRRLKLLSEDNEKLSIIIKLNTSSNFNYLTSNLEDLTSLEIDIVRLESGKFREVDGKLIVKRDNEEKSHLYKVNDRNVKLYNFGELGLVKN